MNHLEDALEMAGAGLAVFPCGFDKAPRVAGGFHSATTDVDTIRSWDWNGGGMIGMAIPEGVIVVDVDPRNGGTETVAALKAVGHELPPTRLVRTRSGGQHRYYSVPEGLELRATLGPGVDIKRPGKGYVIVPPSQGYETRIDIAINEAPEWLLEELVVERGANLDRPSTAKFFPFEDGTPYGLGALNAALGRLATAGEGGRNDALNREAFGMAQLVAGGELDGDHARDELLKVAELIGLEERESVATINSGWSKGEENPRQAPDDKETAPSFTSVTRSQASLGSEEQRWVDWDVEEELPPFFCAPVLPKNAYVLVYGPTEAAKSMTWLGILADASHRGIRSTTYSLENPPALDRDRLRRWGPNRANYRLSNGPLDLADDRQLEAFVKSEIAWATDVILIDTYSHAFNSRSEDGNAKAIEFARRVRYIMAEVGCSVVVVDHTGFQGDEPRDASAKRQQVDVAILMRKSGDWAAGQPSKFTMHNMKSARFGNPFRIAGAIHDIKATRGLELRWPDGGLKWEDA